MTGLLVEVRGRWTWRQRDLILEGLREEEGLVCGIEKQDDQMTEICGGLQSEVRTERDINQNDELTVGMYVLVVYDYRYIKYPGLILKT